MKGLPTGGIRADTAVDVAAITRPELLAVFGAASAPRLEDLFGRLIVEVVDADLVRRSEVDSTLGADVGEKLLDSAIETGLVVLLARRQVREQVAHAPAIASARFLPHVGARAREELIQPRGLGSHQLVGVEPRQILIVDHYVSFLRTAHRNAKRRRRPQRYCRTMAAAVFAGVSPPTT